MANILVVNDEPESLTLLGQILRIQDYSVEELSDGDAALTYLQYNQPDLLVLDIYMPGKEGFEIIRHLKATAHPVKILAISDKWFEGFDTCATARLLGADETLAKPFSIELFLELVERLLPRL